MSQAFEEIGHSSMSHLLSFLLFLLLFLGDCGIEWLAFEHTPIWQINCYSPVIRGSGGFDVPCYGAG